MMRALGHDIGRFKVGRLMEEAALVSKQPGSHAYKVADAERPDIPNHLDREFEVGTPNPVWCGDVRYIWAESRWHYLAVVIDLYSRRVVGWSLSTSAYLWFSMPAAQGHEGASEQRDAVSALLDVETRNSAQQLAMRCFDSGFKDCE
jgi:hypothetical protein